MKEVDKSNNDAVSISGFVIKKENKRGARHGPSERQRNTTRPGKCCIKRVTRNMESTQPFMRDGSAAKDTESRCRTMDGRRATSCYLTELPWEIIYTLRRELSEFVTQNIGF